MNFFLLLFVSIPKIPWKGFLMGFLFPVMLLRCGHYFGHNILFFHLCIFWCLLFFIIDYLIKKWPSLFPLITFFMVLTHFSAVYYAMLKPDSELILSLVPGFGNILIAIIFIFSSFTSKPLIIFLLNKETIENAKIEIRKSSYYWKIWKKITLLWGVVFFIEGLFLIYMELVEPTWETMLEYLFGWPLILALLFASVMIPKWYWFKHYYDIEDEFNKISDADLNTGNS